MHQWKLSIVSGPDIGRTFEIPEDRPLVIGRGADSDTQIRDPRLSRIHCYLAMESGAPVLEDQGSAAGTFYNALPIREPRVLASGCEFQIGDTRLRVDSGDTGASTIIPGGEIRPLEDLVGELLFRYRLDQLVASGKNSAVFRAHDTKRNRTVAVKILKPQMTPTEDQKDRFIRAMRTMLPVKHPNIVRVRKAGRTGPYCWAAMDWIEGISLDNVIKLIGKDGLLDWKEAWHVAIDIGRAIEEAARLKIVHRNITPTNIMRTQPDRTYMLLDLVFARALDVTEAGQITRPGDVIGELPYLAPERLLDTTNLDLRSDLYGLGATLYALLTGEPPFSGANIGEMLGHIQSTDPVRPSQRGVTIDSGFEEIVMRLLAKSPESRYATPADLLASLRKIGQFAGIAFDSSPSSRGT